jgi:hypothetical protein
MPGTTIRSVCPDPAIFPSIQGTEGCDAITADWAGGAFDAVNNRLLIQGGGHAGYAGNETYALNLGDGTGNPTITRLTNPTSTVRDGCVNGGTYADGKPVARHTYDQLAYLPDQNAMFMWGGSQWQCGNMASDTWMLNLTTFVWTRGTDTNKPSGNFSRACAYHPAGHLVYCRDDFVLKSYNPVNDTWTTRSTSFGVGEYKTGVIDTTRHRYYMTTPASSTTLYYYDIRDPASTNLVIQTLTTSGCTWNGQIGMAYDPVQDRIVTWNGGNSVQVYDPTANSCSTVTYSGGPTAMANGTYGRFRYSAKLNVFVTCNDVDVNCYALRLTAPLNTADADFQQRCNAAGVIICENFDNAATFVTPSGSLTGIFPDSGSVIRGTRDTSTKASGAASLKFNLPTNGGANISGFWIQNWNKIFAPNTTFWVQLRYRGDAPFFAENWYADNNTMPKIVIFYNTSSGSCAATEITTVSYRGQGLPNMYHHCGSRDFGDGNNGSNVGLHIQQGDFTCEYPGPFTEPPCYKFKANNWTTLTYKIEQGDCGVANSTITSWVADETNLTPRRYTYAPGYKLDCDGTGYNVLQLLPYMTARSSGVTHAAANVWYDELIVSSQSIAAPGGAIISAPSAVKLIRSRGY